MGRSDSRERRSRRSRSRSDSRGRSSRRSKSRHESHKHKRNRSRSRSAERRHKEQSKEKRRRESRDRGERGAADLEKIAASVSERALQRQKTAEEIARDQEEQRKAEEVRIEEDLRKRRERIKAWQEAKRKKELEDQQKAVEEAKQEEENGAERKAWTLEDDEEDDDDDDAKIEADAQEVADLDKSLPLPPAQAAEEEIAQPLDKRRRVAWSEAEAKTTASATSSTVTATTPVSNHAAMNGTAHAADDDIDPLDAFMSSVLAEVDVVPVADARPALGTQARMVIHEGAPTAKVITLEEIQNRRQLEDWESDIAESPMPSPFEQAEETKEEREEREKREFLEALRRHHRAVDEEGSSDRPHEEPMETSAPAEDADRGLGRIFGGEGDMLEEHEVVEREKSALEILEEAAKKKELKPVDHSKTAYIDFRRNLYIMPRALAQLSPEEVADRRAALEIRVRGKGCPPPVDNWEQCGLSERILTVIYKLQFNEPFPIQKQAIPAIMAGRDIIGVAKTGSGKTLAFLLPMFRHIIDQPSLQEGEGPIGLIMAPARELAVQIYNEARKFTKALGLRVACIYGGAGVAEQIADLKRGAEIIVCTPGRMIDILGMQAGKLVSLRRVTFVVMDEADRMFDMGFEPQIRMVMSQIRPDRQVVLFSATFPKQIEKLAKSVLKAPLEIIVGGRSVASRDITQYVEIHEEDDKFMRLLQLLGLWYERGNVLVFVDKQEKCDSLFQDLLKYGYVSVTLHGGKDQLDRDHTIHEFKTKEKTLMIATSVAGRGLDVPDLVCVINYNCPNHLEDYVHRVGRTGRAGRKGTAYTFISPSEEMYAPMLVKALQQAKQEVPQALIDMANEFKAKVDRGEARWAASGFIGKGFTFDESEKTEAQKFMDAQRKQYLIAEGIINPDEARELDELEAEAEEEAGVLEEEAEAKAEAGPGTEAPAAAAAAPGAAPAAASSAQLAALEKAKDLAKKMSGVEAARRQAELIAAQLGGKPTAAAAAPSLMDHCSDELEINDYPLQARKKVQARDMLERVVEMTGVAIISRGEYIDPTKKPEPGKRKLYLLIEGPSEISVKQARLELLRILEEETLRTGASAAGSTGRYSVV